MVDGAHIVLQEDSRSAIHLLYAATASQQHTVALYIHFIRISSECGCVCVCVRARASWKFATLCARLESSSVHTAHTVEFIHAYEVYRDGIKCIESLSPSLPLAVHGFDRWCNTVNGVPARDGFGKICINVRNAVSLKFDICFDEIIISFIVFRSAAASSLSPRLTTHTWCSLCSSQPFCNTERTSYQVTQSWSSLQCILYFGADWLCVLCKCAVVCASACKRKTDRITFWRD